MSNHTGPITRALAAWRQHLRDKRAPAELELARRKARLVQLLRENFKRDVAVIVREVLAEIDRDVRAKIESDNRGGAP